MNNYFNFSLLFIAIAILCLLIDLSQFFLLGKVITPLLLSIYCGLLLSDLRYAPLAYLAVLQCLESFCFYNSPALPLLYLIPITGIAFYCKKNFYPSIAHCITFAFLCAIFQIYIIEGSLLYITPEPHYAIIKICATLLIGISFSLTIKYWGMLDNRA